MGCGQWRWKVLGEEGGIQGTWWLGGDAAHPLLYCLGLLDVSLSASFLNILNIVGFMKASIKM